MKIHYNLIGSIPQVEHLRENGALEKVILRYLEAAPTDADRELLSIEGAAKYVKRALADPKKLQRLTDGATIEFAAQHFYGLKGEDFNTVNELIDAVWSIEHDNRFK